MTRLFRLMSLIEILHSGRVLTSEELAEILDVSRRTVFRDVSTLQDAGFLVLQDSSRGGYYSPHRLALPPSELSSMEVVALSVLADEFGAGAGGTPFLEAGQSAVSKIRRNLPPSARSAADEIAQTVTVRRPTCEASPLDRKQFEIALRAAATRRQLRINVAESDAESIQTILDIYRILCLGERWHLVGFSSFHQEVRLIEFAAVKRIAPLPSNYSIPERFNLERFLHHSPDGVPTRTGAAESQRKMRIDPGTTWEHQAVASRLAEEIEELQALLNELGEETPSRFRERHMGCIERLRGISAEIAATLPIAQGNVAKAG